jgi:hypothetical protein
VAVHTQRSGTELEACARTIAVRRGGVWFASALERHEQRHDACDRSRAEQDVSHQRFGRGAAIQIVELTRRGLATHGGVIVGCVARGQVSHHARADGERAGADAEPHRCARPVLAGAGRGPCTRHRAIPPRA